MTFVNGVGLPELGIGAGFALWSFRAIASGCAGCAALHRGFDNAFGDNGENAFGEMSAFTKVLGNDGVRRIVVAAAGCCRVTPDELSVVAVLSSAQKHDASLSIAHLDWLMGGRNTKTAFRAACCVGDRFGHAGLAIAEPSIELSPPRRKIGSPILNVVGNA